LWETVDLYDTKINCSLPSLLKKWKEN
jgi:hypothetical protein